LTLKDAGIQLSMPWKKRVADLFTIARGPLALVLIWLGVVRGKDGVQLAFALLLIAITLDTLDGYLARLSHYPYQTWIGAHDVAFDIGFSVALLLYLTSAGFLSPYLAAVHVGLWVWILRGQELTANSLAVLFQAPMYAGVTLAAVLRNVNLIAWIGIWLALMLAFAAKRFFRVRLPAFVHDLSDRIWGE
jgi:phosphatidylglycerophosphate synthase